MSGLNHLHLRKRSAALEPYPARAKWKRFLDHLVLVVGVLGPAASLPQLVKIYSLHNATGLSALTWGIWALMDTPWIIYGFVHRERPIVYTYLLWFSINTLTCIGAVIYGDGLL